MSSIEEKCKEGETAMNEWLKVNNLSYLFVAQTPETFSSLFKGKVKRPDFLVLLESIGLIAIDVKNYTLSGGVYTLELEAEIRLV